MSGSFALIKVVNRGFFLLGSLTSFSRKKKVVNRDMLANVTMLLTLH